MEPKRNAELIKLERKVFDIQNEPMPRGAWWWWFWLFFFDNPENPATPRQLMILWSTKNVREIECNDLKIRLNHPMDRSNLDGAVAAWYFDGETMHHNFLLEQCSLQVSDRGLSSDSSTPTSFAINKTENTVQIGDDFEFSAKAGNDHDFTLPTYRSHTYLGNMGYSIIRLNHLDLGGRLKTEPIQGSAYFQRVFVTAPAIPWYWGIFHFENGGVLTYFRPYLLGKAVKKEISFFDGSNLHEFIDLNVAVSGGKIPTFTVSGENEHETIHFVVQSYSHSSWTFRRRVLGIIPTNLTYNEYPAFISDLKLANKQTGETITAEDLGTSVGNAEHTTGLLL
jgi:hypothetical protein